MREIKFRAWIKELNKMIYGVGFLNGLVIDEKGDSYDGFILQYTGLKDRNGVEIYEGDLFGKMGGDVERPNEYEIHARVYFDNDLAAFCIDDHRGGWEYLSDYLFKSTNQREIIGNIYQNPELLNI